MNEEEFESKTNCDHFLADILEVKGERKCGRCNEILNEQQVAILDVKSQLYVQLEARERKEKTKGGIY